MASFEFRFARRITFRNTRSISRLVVILAVLSITLGVAVMEVAISIVNGFGNEIENKIAGFSAHIQVGVLMDEFESKVEPLPKNNAFIPQVEKLPGVVHISPYLAQPAMMKSKATQEGILLKGIDSTYKWDFYRATLKEGNLPDYQSPDESKEVLISRKLAHLLDVHPGDNVFVYFFKDEVRVRKAKVAGIYETGLEEFDLVQVICDMRLLQNVLGWTENEIMGFEVTLSDMNLDFKLEKEINELLPPEFDATSIRRIYPELFEWVALQHQNVWFILGLMVVIAVINMVSVILILILERTSTIGLLKALGLNNLRTIGIFMYNALFLIAGGVFLGNLLGLGLLFSQDTWGWLKVDQENYFVNVVPVEWTWGAFLLINAGVVVICTLFMFLPSLMVLRVTPTRALRFE